MAFTKQPTVEKAHKNMPMFRSVALKHPFFGFFKINFGKLRNYPAAHTVCLAVGVAGMGFYFRAR